MRHKYRLLKAQLGLDTGAMLVDFDGYDYGMASDHQRITGKQHCSVSHDGDAPFFTVPLEDLEVLK